MWCGSGSHWTERYVLLLPLPRSSPGGMGTGADTGNGGSSSFRDLPLRPHSDPEVASSCLNGVPLKGPVLMSALGLEWGV